MLGQVLQAMQQQWRHQVAPTAQQQQQRQEEEKEEGKQVPSSAPFAPAATSASRPTPAAAAEQQAGPVAQAALHVLSMLQSLAGTGRFELNARLLDRPSKAAAAELCRQLQEVLQHCEQVSAVADDERSSGNGDGGSSSSSASGSRRPADSSTGVPAACASSACSALEALAGVMHKLSV
jgi:hypothetical protein